MRPSSLRSRRPNKHGQEYILYGPESYIHNFKSSVEIAECHLEFPQ